MMQVIRTTFSTVLQFARDPFREITRLPNWSWQQVVGLQVCASFISGVLAGFLPFNLWKILQGAMLFPVVSSAMSAFFAAFLYYYFQIFEERTVPYLRLFHLVVMANLTFLATHVLASLWSPFDLLGLGATSFLMIVGLTENFGVHRKISTKIIGGAFALLFLLWIIDRLLAAS